MGLLDEVGKIAGAVAAVETTEGVDPDAGLLTKAAAVVAGFKGTDVLEEMIEKKDEAKAEDAEAAPEDGVASQARLPAGLKRFGDPRRLTGFLFYRTDEPAAALWFNPIVWSA